MEQTLVLTSEKALFNMIENWADKRNFFGEGGATVADQILKLQEELGELTKDHLRSQNIEDDLGDMLVVLVILARLSGTPLSQTVRVSPEENIFDSIERTCEETNYFQDSGNTVKRQILQLQQQLGALVSAYFEGERISGYIGNILVTLIILAKMSGTSLHHCAQIAYEEIFPRKGEFIGGVYIKEADLNH